MAKKTQVTTQPRNTSATAMPEKSADVLETAAASAVATSTTLPPSEGTTIDGEAQTLPPVGETVLVVGELTGQGGADIADAGGAAIADEIAYTHKIFAVSPKGFCRAGRRWPQEGDLTHEDDWTDEQWAALTSEANLIVRPL